MIILGIAFYQFTTEEKAFASAGVLFVLYALVTVMWNYRGENWFWLTIAVFALIHFLAISFIPFQFPPGPAISYVAPAMFIDGFAMFGILRWLASKLSTDKLDDASS